MSVRPLAADPSGSDDEEATEHSNKLIQRRRWARFGFSISICILVICALATALSLTVFNIKDPIVTINVFKVTKLVLIYRSTLPAPGTNISLVVDMSVKNRNMVSFKYDNTTTTWYYHGIEIGEAERPVGLVKARRTARMNVTVVASADQISTYPDVIDDLSSGLLTLSSYSRIPGRVQVFSKKKHIDLRINCTITFNISSQAIKEQECMS